MRSLGFQLLSCFLHSPERITSQLYYKSVVYRKEYQPVALTCQNRHLKDMDSTKFFITHRLDKLDVVSSETLYLCYLSFFLRQLE